MKNNGKNILFYVVLIAVLLVASTFLIGQKKEEPPEYSEIVKLFENGEVESYTVTAGNILDIKTRDQVKSNGITVKGKEITYKLRNLELFMIDINPIVYNLNHDDNPDNDITSYNYEPPKETSIWITFIPYILVIVFFVVLWFFAMNSAMGGKGGKINSFGKSRARVNLGGKNKVMFTDVAGADEEKEELKEVVDFLKNPKKFTELGAKIPRGVLLVGPPGTGKTLLAKAVAGEANVPFFSISGSDFVEMYVGVGASRVRDLFDTAKKTAPAIVFIDEIDAVGRHRGAGLGGGHDEREQTLNQLLVEMDGFGANVGVIVIAATNRPDILDSALLRPGRFDRQVVVDVPDIIGREAILKVHSRKKPLGSDVDLSVIAKTTAGFTGADLANLLNEAALLAARKSKTEINMQEIEDAMIKVVVGTEKKTRNMSEHEKKLTAYHEAGHAIITRLLPSQDPVHQVSIIPRGRAGGFTMSLPSEDKYYNTKGEMIDSIIVLLGGRSAEALTLNDISTGASNDIQRASKIARDMVTKYGMSDKIGPICFGNDHDEVFIGRDFVQSRNMSEHVSAEIDEEIRDIIDTAYERCKTMLTQNMDKLRAVAEVLIEREKISGEEFEKVFNGEKLDGLKFEGVSEDTAVSAEENTENSDNSSNSENTGADDTDTNA